MAEALTETLQAIGDESSGGEITSNEINQAMQNRGFGALLIAPGLIVILPTGAIPGVPAICALFIILVAVQAAVGRTHPWLPERIKKISFDKKRYDRSIKAAKPYTHCIDSFFHERFALFTQKTAQRVIAVMCVFLGLGIIILGVIPFAAMLPAAAILMFGLGLSVKDGLLTLGGVFFVVLTICVATALLFF